MNARDKADIREIAEGLIQLNDRMIKLYSDASTAARFADLIEQAQTSREDLLWYLQRLDTEDDWLELLEDCKAQTEYLESMLRDTESLIAENRRKR
jgi:hypothetical protein